LIAADPTKGLEFMPVEKRVKDIPPKEDVAKVLLAADPDTQVTFLPSKRPWLGWEK
jgi:hypothetical protein